MIKKIYPPKDDGIMNENNEGFVESTEELLAEQAQLEQELPEQAQAKPNSPAKGHSNRRPRAMYFLLLAIFSSVFILSGIYLAHYLIEQNQAASQYDDLNQLLGSIQSAQTTAPTEPSEPPVSQGPSEPTAPPVTEAPTMLPEYAAVYALNNDLVGWINIPSIKAKYPVMQTPDRPDFYLRKDFYGKYHTSGCLYVREACDVFAPSDNVVIYGHAMKTGDMFGRLHYFREKSYCEKNRYFTFDTLYEHHDYEIFAVFRTSGTWGIGYPYHVFNDAADEAAFDKFIADIQGPAFTMDKNKLDYENLFLGSLYYYNSDIIPKYGDKLVTLSTCEYTIRDPGTNAQNGRLVILAIQVDCVCDK